MRKTTNPTHAARLTVGLIGVLLLVAGPGTAQAENPSRGSQSPAGYLGAGAGYSQHDGSASVRALQRQLLRAGEPPGPIDGRFGPLTAAAVRHFQAREGLVVDGLVGPMTAAAIRREAAVIAPGAGYSEPHGSNRVRALQRRLRRAGERPGPIDGRFGPLTEAAVRNLQRHHGLAVDGVVGEATHGTLARFAASEVPSANPEPRAKPAKERQPASGRKIEPAAGLDDHGLDLPGWSAAVAIAAVALALFLVGLPLALGRQARRRHAGAHVANAPRTGPMRAKPSTPGARPLERPGPPAIEAGRLDGRRARDEYADTPSQPRDPGVLGYTSVSGPAGSVNGWELRQQAQVIAGECERRGLELIDLMRDREPRNGKAIQRAGLAAAIGRISAGEARGLVVSELSRLSRSAAELGTILEWFIRAEARLVAVAEGLDTDEPEGRLTIRTLIDVSRWERDRLRERTRKGLQATRVKWRPAVADNPELHQHPDAG